MRPTRWTGSAAVVAAVLGTIGLFFDAPAAAGASVGLAALLAGGAVLFLYRTIRYADTLAVERVIGTGLVCQGTPVEVGVQVTGEAVSGLAVRIMDLPPRSAVHDPKETVLKGGEGRYRIRLMAPGEVFFRGLRVEVADRFFTTTLFCTAPRFAGTMLTVYSPDSYRHEKGPGSGAGELEIERKGVLRGQGIRSFRPFRSGDDPALMDWKLSAKHGRLFVREPNSQVGGPPLLIVDLPVVGAEGGEDLLLAAGEAIEREIREYDHCTLLVIAGGEVIGFWYHEQDLPALVRNLRSRPADSVAPLYRVYDPIVLKRRLRAAERGVSEPSRRFAAVLRATLGSSSAFAFEEEVGRILASVEHPEVIVYTAATDEISHLNLIAVAARRHDRTLRILLTRPGPGLLARLSSYARVEVL
ncbi:DUF58 domain-containing protein [Methanosphaerula palustris]|uniref:DUF58 domain-containing protein n=1 Tax=Methanosphaerula palustris (strain ATCC BAA-1556 / DSM 19958 / E1-9c) TaxID=521011 RepID=B8GJW0_METPE|nr:DUF58 domain-containing protein [Methanosphaerula palustris]ACL15764.1 protein of unknown function DUF58 [Methanosphaerula palustris E1-9c]